MFYVLFMASPETAELLSWFQKMAPDEYFDRLIREHNLRCRKRIYWLAVVVWLMIFQRLHPNPSLAAAVDALVQGGGFRWSRSKRRQHGRPVSPATGGYCQARQRLPTLVAKQVSDHIFEQLRTHLKGSGPDLKRPVFVIDGSTLQLQHEPDLVAEFPPGHNQHGRNHWPVMLIVAFHDAYTGLAARPSWGAMYGPKAVSEQHLAEEALHRLPADATVLADGNFGIFAFAYAVQRSQRTLLLRLTASRAQKLLGGVLRKGTHRRLNWKASRWDRQAHPELPEAARIDGWVVVCENPARRQEKLCLFTTLDLSPEDLVATYKLRWNIETDLRSLKRTVGLHQIHSRAVSMAEKELVLAVAAYNFVRAIMAVAAQRAGLCPRELSFARAQSVVMAALPGLHRAAQTDEYNEQMDDLLSYVVQAARLPHRQRKRSYPRLVWGRGGTFPSRKTPPGKENLP
jgi:putative transposase